MISFVPFLVFSYLIGSIPTAFWLGKAIYGVDIRQHGSGNSGATNSMRVLGKGAGFTVLIIDILKGWGIVLLARALDFRMEDQFLFGLAAVMGHILSIFAGFRGGKGIATSFGIILALNPIGALCSTMVFMVVVALSKYVSLGSLLGSFAFLMYSISFGENNLFFLLACTALFLLLCYTHRSNIGRLIQGKENKFPPK